MATTTVLRQRQPSVQESLSPQQLREWAIWWGSPGRRASRARAGGAGAGGSRTRRQETLSSQQLCKRAVWWGSSSGGAWGATTGCPCESTPAGRRGGFGGGQQQQQQRSPENLFQQQLRAWAVRWGSPGGRGFRSTRTGDVEAPGGVEAASLGAFDSASTESPLAPPSWPPLLAMHAWHTLPSPCVRSSRRAAPHSSSFPPTTAPLYTLHMDVWGPARVTGQGGERYFLLVVDDYTRYTTVFPLQSKADVRGVLIRWIRAVRLQPRARFCQDLPILWLHSDRGGEFAPASSKNSVVAHTSMIHAAAPHFLWPFAVRYAAEQLNLWPRVSHPETSPNLRWTGEVGDASAFRVWGSLSLVRDLPADKLSPRTVRCVFLGFPTDAPPRRPAPSGVSQVDPRPLVEPLEVSFDTSGPAEGGDQIASDTVAPRRSARLAVPPSFPPRPSSPPLQPVVVDSGAAGGGDTGGAHSGGAGSRGPASPLGAGGAGGAAAGVSAGGGASGAGAGGAVAGGAGARRQETLSPERLRKWAVCWGSPGGGAGRAGAADSESTGPGGASGGVPRVGCGGGLGGGTGGAGPVGASVVVPGVGGTGTADTRAGTGAATFCVSHLLSLPPAATEFPVAGTTPPLLFPLTDQSQPQFLPGSPLPAPAPHTEVTKSLTERREPETLASTTVRAHRVARPRALAVPGTHRMALCPSSVPQRVVLPSPPASSLPHVPDPESDLVRTATPTITRLLATVVIEPSFESAATSALVAELVDFAALCCLDYAASLVFLFSFPPSVGGELALGCDTLEDRQFELECLAAAVPHLASTLPCPEGDPDALDISTSRSYADAITGTYIDKVPSPGTNIVNGMWIFWVKRPPGSPPAFKARYVARGFSQCEGVNFFQTFSPTPKMTTPQVLLHIAAHRDYELLSLDFSTAFLQGSLHEAIWLRRPRGFTGLFLAGTQWGLR
ncbi:unnamed protein product [Closterium sp. NIES-53]